MCELMNSLTRTRCELDGGRADDILAHNSRISATVWVYSRADCADAAVHTQSCLSFVPLVRASG
jgi:hypothetical protein